MNCRIPSEQLFKAIIAEASACLNDTRWSEHLENIQRSVDVLRQRIADYELWSDRSLAVLKELREADSRGGKYDKV
jgi:hypothetical protein